MEEEEEMERRNRVLFGLESESPDSGSVEKVAEKFDTKLDDKV